jgi:ABC-2 type transport system permease protein
MVFYLMMGFIMVDINPPFLETLIPSMVIFGVMAATLLSIPEYLVRAREDGIFRSYRINGVPSTAILAVPALTSTAHMVIVSTLITFSAAPLFGAPTPVNWAAFALTFLALTVAFVGISVLNGVISPSSNVQIMVSQLIFIPSTLLGGIMIPISVLPEAAGKVARIFPAAHAMNAFNALAMGRPADFSAWGSIAMLLLSGAIAFGLAIYMFNWDRRNATQRGHPLLALLAFAPFAASIFIF